MQVGTENKIELYLIRHGMTLSNEQHRYLGRTDEPLSETGKKQLQEQKTALQEYGREAAWIPDFVFSGPMLRCGQTAELLFPEQVPLIVEEWREIDFGSFEGKTYQELSGDEDYQKWIESGGSIPFPGGESREQLIERSMKGLFYVLKTVTEKKYINIEKPGKIKVASVVHGGNVMAVMSRLTGEDYFDFQVKNGEWVHLIFQGCELLSWDMGRSL